MRHHQSPFSRYNTFTAIWHLSLWQAVFFCIASQAATIRTIQFFLCRRPNDKCARRAVTMLPTQWYFVCVCVFPPLRHARKTICFSIFAYRTRPFMYLDECVCVFVCMLAYVIVGVYVEGSSPLANGALRQSFGDWGGTYVTLKHLTLMLRRTEVLVVLVWFSTLVLRHTISKRYMYNTHTNAIDGV